MAEASGLGRAPTGGEVSEGLKAHWVQAHSAQRKKSRGLSRGVHRQIWTYQPASQPARAP